MKMNGYRASHRNRWLLLETKTLTPNELFLFEYIIDRAVFDKSKEEYGIAHIQISRIAEIFQYSARNSIYTKLSKLETVGLIKKVEVGWTKLRITNFPRYLLQNKPQFGSAHTYSKNETNQSTEQRLQSIGIEGQSIDQSTQYTEQSDYQIQTSDDSKALDSFKVNSPSLGSSKKSVYDYSFKSDLPLSEQQLINESIEESTSCN